MLRASFCKYGESGDSLKIFTFFIFCPNKVFSELFSKIQLKDPKASSFYIIEESLKIAILASRRLSKLTKMMHFRFARAGKRDNI